MRKIQLRHYDMNRRYIMTTLFSVATLLAVATGQTFSETMTIDNCVAYAHEHSPALTRLWVTHDNQKLSTMIERAAFDTGLSAAFSQDVDSEDGTAAATLSKQIPGDINVALGASLSFDDTDSESYSVTLSKIILGGGSFRASRLGINNSILDETVNLNIANRYKRELVYRVKEIYYRIIRDIQALKIREMKLARSKKNLEHAVARELPLDIATAQIEVPENESAVLEAKRAIDSSYDDLKNLIGMDIAKSVEIDPGFAFKRQTVDAAAGIKHCFENDELVINARLAQRKAENEADARRVEVLPEVALSGTARRDDDPSETEETEYLAGVSLSWDLWLRSERASYRRATNAVRIKELELRELQLATTKQIRDLARRIDESSSQINIQDKRVELGLRLAEIYRDKWENGEIDILEYVRSQNDLENNKIRLLNLKSSYMELLAEYEFVVARH